MNRRVKLALSRSSERSDEELVRAVVLGDERAFESLILRHGSAVRAVCARHLNQPEDVDEAVQDTFFRAYRALPGIQYQNLRGWLYCIARNVCRDRIRRAASRPSSVQIDAYVAGVESGPDEIVAGGDPRIELALTRLSHDHRAAVELRFVHELSHREMAVVMSKSSTQVKALIHRAKCRLQAELAVA